MPTDRIRSQVSAEHPPEPVTLVMIARIPASGVGRFQRYEAGVLPLLGDHGGRLERRLRSDDGRVEIHIVRFSSAAGARAYREDPRRAELGPLLTASEADQEVFELTDVDVGGHGVARP